MIIWLAIGVHVATWMTSCPNSTPTAKNSGHHRDSLPIDSCHFGLTTPAGHYSSIKVPGYGVVSLTFVQPLIEWQLAALFEAPRGFTSQRTLQSQHVLLRN
jgi:hypothetical protein